MRRTALGRWIAFLLAATFVGGGLGLPDFDAVLYHSGPRASHADAPHFDLPGGCGAHAEHCVLTLAASVRPLAATAQNGFAITRVGTVERAALPLSVPPSAKPANLHLSRAPPAHAS